MAITAAELRVVVGWDDNEMRSGARKSEGLLNDMSVRLGGVVRGTAAIAVDIAAVALRGTTAIINSTMTMQDVLMPVGTLVGANSAKFEALSESIKDVIKTSPADPKDVGMAAYQILSAGITDTTKASDALRASIKLSQAGLGTTEQATSLVTSAMNSFKNENLTANDAAKIFFGTIMSGKTTTSDLTQGFGQIAPLAAMVGIKFSDLMSATAALTGVGQPASTAFAGIRAALSNILQPTTDAAKAAEKLGVDFSAAHLGAVGLPAFLKEMADATGGDTEILAQFFGSSEAISSIGTLMGPASEAFATNVNTIVASGQSLDERAKEVSETWSNRLKILKNNLLVFGSEIGNNIWDKAVGWWKDHGPAVVAIVDEVRGGFTAFLAAFKAGGDDVTSNGLAGKMEHFGLIARRVVEGFKEYWPKVRELIEGLIDWVSWNLVPRAQEYFALFMKVAEDVVTFFKDNWPAIKDAMVSVWEVVQEVLELAGLMFDNFVADANKVWDKFGDEIMAVAQYLFDHLLPIFVNLMNFIRDTIRIVIALIKGDWGGAWNAMKDLLSDIWEGIKNTVRLGVDALINLAKAIGPGVSYAVVGVWSDLKNGFRDAINWIIDTWNNLEFKIPGTSIGIGTPNIARLGGSAGNGSGLTGTWSMAGVMEPDTTWLPERSSMPASLGSSSTGGYGPQSVTVNMPAGSSGDDVVRALREYQRRNGAIPISTSGRSR